MNMNAVGIDVSKRKSMVSILRPGGEVVAKPFEVPLLNWVGGYVRYQRYSTLGKIGVNPHQFTQFI